jgi:hypothetical protein
MSSYLYLAHPHIQKMLIVWKADIPIHRQCGQ